MKVVLITSYACSGNVSVTDNLLLAELKRRKIDTRIINPDKVSVVVGNRLSVYHGKELISDSDVMIVKRTRDRELEIFQIARAMEVAGVKVVDNTDSLRYATDKLLTQINRAGINCPASIFTNTIDENVNTLIKKHIKPPFIVKPQDGVKSRGVMEFEDYDISEYIKHHPEYKPIVQEMVTVKEKYRVITIGGKSIGCWVDYRNDKNKRKREAIREKDIESFAEKAVERELGDIYGVDIISDGKKLWLIECNRNPGFMSFRNKSGVNVEKLIIDYCIC